MSNSNEKRGGDASAKTPRRPELTTGPGPVRRIGHPFDERGGQQRGRDEDVGRDRDQRPHVGTAAVRMGGVYHEMTQDRPGDNCSGGGTGGQAARATPT